MPDVDETSQGQETDPQPGDTTASAVTAAESALDETGNTGSEVEAAQSGEQGEGDEQGAEKDSAVEASQESATPEQSDSMPCQNCSGRLCLNASCAMYAAVGKPEAELIATRQAMQEAEAKLAEANKAIASLESEKASLKVKVASIEKALQQTVVAHRLGQLGQVMTAEQMEPYKDRIGLMDDTDFNLVLAAASAKAPESPKPGSLKGNFVLSDKPTEGKDQVETPKTFRNIFANIEAR